MARRTCLLLAAWLCAATAEAHKISVFAAVRDRRIEGQVTMPGGAPAPGTRVTIVDARGGELARCVADQEGKFTFVPRHGGDHRIVANAGLGHKAEYLVPASELPADLPPPGSDLPPPPDRRLPPGGATDVAAMAENEPAADSAPSVLPDDSAREIRALTQQISALRVDLDRWRHELRVQDLLGGVGYILGISGLAFYALGSRRRRQ